MQLNTNINIESVTDELERKVMNILLDLKFNISHAGFFYLAKLISLYVVYFEKGNMRCQDYLDIIGDHYKSKAINVESNIRKAILAAYESSPLNFKEKHLSKFYGDSHPYPPSTKALAIYIATMIKCGEMK